ncbi:MAG: hypothetical protein IKE34_03855, partial [Paenibacillus sp.]|nr:hypothetical protein [Paenibacillus sp.]
MIRIRQRMKVIVYLLLLVGAPLIIAFMWSGKLEQASTEAVGAVQSRTLPQTTKVVQLDMDKDQHKDAQRLNTAEEKQALLQMEKMAENEHLKLYLNKTTAEIAVVDKKSGYTWFSNPQSRQADTIATPLYQAELASQLIVNYFSENGQLIRMNSYDESVMKQQFSIEPMDDGVQVTYLLGNAGDKRGRIPQAIHKNQMESKILSKLPDDDARKRWLSRYRLDEGTGIYRLRQLQDYIAEEMAAQLSEIGYTEEDAQADEGEVEIEQTKTKQKPEFEIVMQYQLDGEQFIAAVPTDKIVYKPTFLIASIDALPFFGAAGQEANGYMFVPDGSGALIQLNSNKLNAEPFVMPLYGSDEMFQIEEQWQVNEKARMPVFGMKQDDQAWMAVIEDGD